MGRCRDSAGRAGLPKWGSARLGGVGGGVPSRAWQAGYQPERGRETMANPFVKGWKYLMALFGAKIDEYADPKVQIQQAIEDAQRQHQALVQQAAAVIGNQRQLEMKLSRQLTEVEKLQSNARQALVLADRARETGDNTKATDYENTAQTFATQLVSAEQ